MRGKGAAWPGEGRVNQRLSLLFFPGLAAPGSSISLGRDLNHGAEHVSLESPCAPRVSRTLSEMLRLISKAAAGPGPAGDKQEAMTEERRWSLCGEAEMQLDGEPLPSAAAASAALPMHTHLHTHCK